MSDRVDLLKLLDAVEGFEKEAEARVADVFYELTEKPPERDESEAKLYAVATSLRSKLEAQEAAEAEDLPTAAEIFSGERDEEAAFLAEAFEKGREQKRTGDPSSYGGSD